MGLLRCAVLSWFLFTEITSHMDWLCKTPMSSTKSASYTVISTCFVLMYSSGRSRNEGRMTSWTKPARSLYGSWAKPLFSKTNFNSSPTHFLKLFSQKKGIIFDLTLGLFGLEPVVTGNRGKPFCVWDKQRNKNTKKLHCQRRNFRR